MFKRTVENFICDYCRVFVVGNGYTNHCPHCLTGKHVDESPGDRKSHCHGLMEPIDYESRNQIIFLVHRCQRCGGIKKNKLAKEDGDAFRSLIKRLSEKKFFS